MKSKTIFQSYLVLGTRKDARDQTEKIAKSQNLSLKANSPDTWMVTPQKQHISIDQVRDFKKQIFQKPFREKFKFSIFESANTLTIPAQNALLKILEEPPKHAIIVLESKNKSTLLPTILSRVVLINTASNKYQSGPPNILETEDLREALEEIASVTDPHEWLEKQMLAAHKHLILNIKQKNTDQIHNLSFMLESLKESKGMLDANVNPKFVLFDLIFKLRLNPNFQPQNSLHRHQAF